MIEKYKKIVIKPSLIFLAVFYIFYFGEVILSWPLLRHMGIRGGRNFEDLYAILGAAKCKPPSFIPGTDNLCIFPYGSTLHGVLRISPFPLGLWNFFGWVLIGLIGVLLYFVSKLNSIGDRWTTSLYVVTFCSPPIILLLERGNFDAVMVLIICFAGYCLGTNRQGAGVILLIISALFKFYTLPLLVITFVLSKRVRIRILSCVGLIASIATVWIDREVISSGTHIGAFAAFGTPVYGSYLNKLDDQIHLSYSNSHIFGLIAFVISVICGIYLLRMKSIFLPKQSMKSKTNDLTSGEWIYVLTSSTTISCFMLSNNFDYRLIYILITGVMYLKLYSLNRKQMIFAVFTIIGVAWMNYDVWSLEPFGNTILFFGLTIITIDLYIHYFRKSNFGVLNFSKK
jgi:hypothetical protein